MKAWVWLVALTVIGIPPQLWSGLRAAEKVDDAWLKQVAPLPAEKQVESVAQKLKELNPAFDGKVTPKSEEGVVTELEFVTDNVTDLSPIRALAGLRKLDCRGNEGKGKLADLAPLKGMKLTVLNCSSTKVADLAPLKGMPLTSLSCSSTPLSDLSPLKGMLLTKLDCSNTKVADLSPLQQLSLTELRCQDTQVADLSPLQGMNLTEVTLKPRSIKSGMNLVRQMKSLKTIGIGHEAKDRFSPEDFWKKYDSGEFSK